MIPSIDFIRDLTEYSIAVEEVIKLSGTNKNVLSFKNILDRINLKINKKADVGEKEYIISFNINKFINNEELNKNLIDNKIKRADILSKVFKKFGYKVETFIYNEHPSLKISW